MDKKIALLIKLYTEQPLAVDRLPYTIEFDRIVEEYSRQLNEKVEHIVIYRRLVNMRKQCLLPKKRLIGKYMKKI